MSYLIHTPQGKTTRLNKSTQLKEILGLYTDEFSICQFVVLIGQDRISLTHADIRTPAQVIEEEIKWVGEDCEKVLIYNKEYAQKVRAVISNQIDESLNEKFILKIWSDKGFNWQGNWIRKAVNNTIIGISVQFQQIENSTLHKNIEPFLRKPINLLRHPKEKLFLTALKIEQAICFASSTMPNKQNLIFDGSKWQSIPSDEFKVQHSNPQLIKNYLDFIKEDNFFIKIAIRLSEVRKDILKNNFEVKMLDDNETNSCIRSAKHFQYYLSKSTPEQIYLHDVEEIINDYEMRNSYDQSYYPLISIEDKMIFASLKELIQSKKGNFQLIDTLITEYENTAKNTPFKQYLITNHKTGPKDNYIERLGYLDNNNELIFLNPNEIGLKLRQASANEGICPDLNYENFVKISINKNVHLSQSSNGNTALHWSFVKNQFDKSSILLKAIMQLEKDDFQKILVLANKEGKTVGDLFDEKINAIPYQLKTNFQRLLSPDKEKSSIRFNK
ncbi:MAG: hypothetical protein JWM09_305 [Francisellaceae bacterium]|nr:hypothetical protein [Francisellaceae bacterium]